MTGKERLLTVLRGGIPDRVPVCPFVQEEYLNAYYGRSDCSRVTEAVRLARELDFDALTRDTFHIEPFFTRQSYPNWEVEKRQYVENGVAHRVLDILTPKGTLKQHEVAPYDPKTIGGVHFITREYLFSNLERAYEIFKAYLPEPSKAYREEMNAHAAWAIAQVGDQGLCCPWGTGGVYNTASTMRSVEDLMCDPYEDEEQYKAFMTLISDWIARDYQWLAQAGYDILGIQGNIANGGMLSCDFFEEFVMPYEEKIISAVSGEGKLTLYHNCGKARSLYPAYGKMHMSLFETLSPAPQGDNDFAEAKRILGQDKTLSGNLDQVCFLKTATPDEVKQATRALVKASKAKGRYVFACSDFLENGTPVENVKAMLLAAKEAGAYGEKEEVY